MLVEGEGAEANDTVFRGGNDVNIQLITRLPL